MPSAAALRRAFTLIELLIVVAIIAVLAAIAVPNFLEAQTRAKVSRCLSDLRSLAGAVEAYRVDWNGYPPYGRIAANGSNQYPALQNAIDDQMCYIGPTITTPIAYIGNWFPDPFAGKFTGDPLRRCVEYLNLDQHVANFSSPPPAFASLLIPAWGHWRMVAAGPDGDRGMDIKLNVVYDPTNGTVSDGDIVRFQNGNESRMNPSAP